MKSTRNITLKLTPELENSMLTDLKRRGYGTFTSLVHEILFLHYEEKQKETQQQTHKQTSQQQREEQWSIARAQKAQEREQAVRKKARQKRFKLLDDMDYDETAQEIVMPDGERHPCLPDRISWYTSPDAVRINNFEGRMVRRITIPAGLRLNIGTRTLLRADGYAHVESFKSHEAVNAHPDLFNPSLWVHSDERLPDPEPDEEDGADYLKNYIAKLDAEGSRGEPLSAEEIEFIKKGTMK